jgi:hypothetical protein
VGFAREPVLHPETIVSSELLAFADVQPVRVPAVAIEQHVAEKLHAYTRTNADEKPSSRVNDLVDLVVIASTTEVDAGRLREATEKIFGQRATHDAPSAAPAPPRDWATSWRWLVAACPRMPTSTPDGERPRHSSIPYSPATSAAGDGTGTA